MATSSTKTATRTTKAKAKTPVKPTAAKPAAAKAAPAKAAPANAVTTAPKATVVETVKPVVADAPIKKPELIDRVMAETGMKKKDVKPVVEGMLAVLGRALCDGEELIVPPLGKVMVKRRKDVANARVMNIKVRHPNTAGTAAKPPLAEPAE